MTERATYSLLLRSAGRAAVLALAAKVLSVIVIANLEGAVIELRTFAAIIPYLSVSSGPTAFLAISTYSTLVMALTSSLYVAPALLRASTPSQRTWGRLLGVVISAETLALQLFLQYAGWPNLLTDRVWWIVLVLLAGLVLGSAGLGFSFRAPRADPRSPRPLAT